MSGTAGAAFVFLPSPHAIAPLPSAAANSYGFHGISCWKSMAMRWKKGAMGADFHIYRIRQPLLEHWREVAARAGFTASLVAEKFCDHASERIKPFLLRKWNLNFGNKTLMIGEGCYQDYSFMPGAIAIRNWRELHGSDFQVTRFFESMLCASGAAPCQKTSSRRLFRCSCELAHNWPSLIRPASADVRVFENSPARAEAGNDNSSWKCGRVQRRRFSVEVYSGPALSENQEAAFLALDYQQTLFRAMKRNPLWDEINNKILSHGAVPLDLSIRGELFEWMEAPS